MRRADLIALTVAAVLGLALLASGAFAADDPPHIERAGAASGALALSNSRSGAAIFAADHLRPGDQVSGTLTLGNTGDRAGRLLLSRTGLTDSLGRGGARLSDVLTLRVEDVTSGTPTDVVAGTLAGLQNVLLRDLPGGASRTYRFVVAWPDRGPGADNAFMGASVRMDYEWLTEAIEPAPTPTPTGTATPKPKPPVTKPAPAPRGAAPAPRSQPRSAALAPRLSLLVPHQRVMHTAFVRVLARCSENCTVTFSGRAKTAARGRRSRVVMKRGLFRGERKVRAVKVSRRGPVRLKLSKRGRAVLRRTLDSQGRVAVVIRAKVRGARGTRRVKKRIVLHTTLIRNGKRINFR